MRWRAVVSRHGSKKKRKRKRKRKRDFSLLQADTFAGANAEEKIGLLRSE